MYTDDIISVPTTTSTDDTASVPTIATNADDASSQIHDPTTVLPVVGSERLDVVAESDGPEPSNRTAVVAALVATLVLIATMGFVALRGGESTTAEAGSPDRSGLAPDGSPSTGTSASTSLPTPLQPVPSAVPAPPSITAPPIDTAPPVVPPPVEPPVAPPVETIAPVVPPAPAGELAAQTDYALDPGVDAVSIALSNQGDLALSYEIVNDGAGFSADVPVGDIEPGASVNVWIDLDLVADAEGPTLFEQVVDVSSNGGDVAVTISGQVEKPGFVIAEFDSVPLVDYRATLRFTNVGGLPVEIVGLDAPGLRYAPIPDQIAAGETYELDIAICDGDGPLPIFVPHPQLFPTPPTFTVGSWVELETVSGADVDPVVARTDVDAYLPFFDPLDCTPVVKVPVGDISIGLG